MPEPLLLVAALAAAGAAVLLPLWRSAPASGAPDEEREAAELRHRVALEALRDVEVDRRAGSLDDDAYRRQRAEAEARAAATRGALARPASAGAVAPPRSRPPLVIGAAAAIAAVLLAASLVPASGVPNGTVVNQGLAAAQAAEAARQERIADLTEALADDPDDPGTLSDLADAYLAGSSARDLAAAASALQLLIAVEPDRADAYERIVAAYLRAGDFANARAALDAYETTASADPVEVAFLDGLIALRGEDDPERALAAFDRFLELAPDDERVRMIRSLREDLAPGG